MVQDSTTKSGQFRAKQALFQELVGYLGEIQDILALEDGPSDDERSRAAVKFHQLKGGAGFLGLSEIERVTRQIEQILTSKEFCFERMRITLLHLVGTLQEETVKLGDETTEGNKQE